MHEFPQNGALGNSKPADAHIGMSPSRDPHQIEQERGRAHVRVSMMYPRSRRSLYSAARGSVDYLGSSNRKSRRLFSMAKKPDVVRFAVGNPDGPQSPVWRLWTSGKGSDVYLAARTIADQAKVSFHKSGKWRLAFTEKYASGPNSYVRPGEDRATSKWHRPPEVAPDITRSFLIMVPASEVTSPKVPFASKPDTIWVPTAPSRLATCLTIFFTTPAADIGRITADIGRISSFTQSVGRIRLRNRETVRVFAHHQQMTESQKTTIARGRVEVARSSHREDRSPEEFNSAFFFGLEKGVGFAWWFQTRASPQLPKGGNRNQTLSTELPIPFILGNPYSASRILVL